MYSIRKKFRFEASHILSSSYSKACQSLHGHSYVVELFFWSKELNRDGMVIDFGEVKDIIGSLIEQFDHATVTGPDTMLNLPAKSKRVHMTNNPTAENMARYFYERIKRLLPQLETVRVHETETGFAECYEEGFDNESP
jgi:6-pyruvoyltetrahydropterin/6-carboxytetrahydropterin synthase